MEKVAGAAKTRIAARQHKETQRRKNALESSALPAKLADCRATDDRTELFIVEGDSALGTAKLARNSEFQALLPIRGKILNVQKASVARHAQEHRVRLDHPGGRRRHRASTFDLDATRYSKIIFMADADSDGAHIRCLLATLFFKYMPELIARRAGSTRPSRRCTGSRSPTPRRAWTSTSTPTPTTSCSGSSPS